MQRKRQNSEIPEHDGLVLALVVFGAVLAGLLFYIFWRGELGLVWSLMLAVVPVAVSLTWLWSRMR